MKKIRKEIDARKSLSDQQKREYFDYLNRLEKRFGLNLSSIPLDASVSEITQRHHEINAQILYKFQIAESLIEIMKLHPEYIPLNKISRHDSIEDIVDRFSFVELFEEIHFFRLQKTEENIVKTIDNN